MKLRRLTEHAINTAHAAEDAVVLALETRTKAQRAAQEYRQAKVRLKAARKVAKATKQEAGETLAAAAIAEKAVKRTRKRRNVPPRPWSNSKPGRKARRKPPPSPRRKSSRLLTPSRPPGLLAAIPSRPPPARFQSLPSGRRLPSPTREATRLLSPKRHGFLTLPSLYPAAPD